jgi:hypothetical protein
VGQLENQYKRSPQEKDVIKKNHNRSILMEEYKSIKCSYTGGTRRRRYTILGDTNNINMQTETLLMKMTILQSGGQHKKMKAHKSILNLKLQRMMKRWSQKRCRTVQQSHGTMLRKKRGNH